jgi:hypothetical protein
MSAPTTIDDVILRLREIIEESSAERDRRGYFAALYNRVTMAVRDGIARGDFDDGPRMARFDVTFANRYLAAYDAYRSGGAVPRVWQHAFDAAQREGLFVIQHLLLGMNAHITLDLGVAAATAAPGPALPALHDDYDRINDVLASLVGTNEAELVDIAGRWDPPVGRLLALAEHLCHGTERSAARHVMDAARAASWKFATTLSRLDPGEWHAHVARQDEEAALLSDTVLLTSPAIDLLAGGGSHDVAHNIRVLAAGEMG